MERVLKNLAAHNHLSSLILSSIVSKDPSITGVSTTNENLSEGRKLKKIHRFKKKCPKKDASQYSGQ